MEKEPSRQENFRMSFQNTMKDYTSSHRFLRKMHRDFIRTAKELKELGYDEVNLNLGCPSRTVVAKQKGSGFLREPEVSR